MRFTLNDQNRLILYQTSDNQFIDWILRKS